MAALVEKEHIYIAQPPLYKIKRGKREEYIQTEDNFNELLLELGSEGMAPVGNPAPPSPQRLDLLT